MGTFTKGDIVLFPFPYTDLSARKLRPCLVLSEEFRDDILLCQITSKKIMADNFTVELKNAETLDGSLQVDSYIRANMLFTAEKRQIIRKVCKTNEGKYKEVVNKIVNLIAW